MFAAFGRRVVEQIAPLVADPLIAQYWPLVVGAERDTDNLGACLAQARHQLEGRWGLRDVGGSAESRCAAGEAFQWFAAHLLAELPRFRHTYNEAVREYRRAHRVRSSAHPAPDLAEEGELARGPVLGLDGRRPASPAAVRAVRRGAKSCSPTGSRGRPGCRCGPTAMLADAVERLMELQHAGVRIRSRALDHDALGTAGAGRSVRPRHRRREVRRGDRSADRAVLRPASAGFMVLSATLHLPIERPRAIRR